VLAELRQDVGRFARGKKARIDEQVETDAGVGAWGDEFRQQQQRRVAGHVTDRLARPIGTGLFHERVGDAACQHGEAAIAHGRDGVVRNRNRNHPFQVGR
jgi:hypothetical protein